MDPVQKIWLYYQWLGDQRDDAELAKNHAYLLGSFWNPEAVREMTNQNVHESTDEELKESMRMVTETDINAMIYENKPVISENKPIKRRRNRATLKE